MSGTEGRAIIEVHSITKLYGRRNEVRAVDGLSLSVREGETFGLLGPNGSGKTTTIRILNGIIRPTSGRAAVNGFDVVSQSNEVKRSTGLLAESPGLYEKLSPAEYLEFVGSLYDVPGTFFRGGSSACCPCSIWRGAGTICWKASARA